MRELERDRTQHQNALGALVVVGRGRLGSAVAATAAAAGCDVTLAGRDDAVEACRGHAAVLLCVPDRAIAEAAAAVAAAEPPLRYAGHTSGATGLEPLSPLADRGADVFSLHPLQTVPAATKAPLTGSPAAVAGSTPEAAGFASALARELGLRPFELPPESRAAYHAAASIASNFLIALEESAADLLDAAGIEGGRDLLAPLVLQTAANWAERGGEALTGPIARGDEQTVSRHLAALRETRPELVEIYAAMAERTRAVAERNRQAAGRS